MIDIRDKETVTRMATVRGTIFLQPSTIAAVKGGKIKKGDPLQAAQLVAMLGAKQTPLLLPHCHPIPITGVATDFEISADSVIVTTSVTAVAKTGVEMEAIVATELALATIWDMVKYLEKDADGQYPTARITDIHVKQKVKG
ncbi:cyclic pyranopterin monophosphate synthase MoaC [Candidatus Woesearchaeota archaeon]|nr:cyclic pyranopterin monophosphate synthase MoaC [Candidatus Woesearchaeota archaeon]